MTVGTNDIAVNSAYASLTPGGNAEDQLSSGTPFFIVVNAEAGSEAIGLGIAYRLQVILLNITNNYLNEFQTVITGHLGGPDPWATSAHAFSFPHVAGPQDTLYRITTVLASGVTGQGLNVNESEIFAVTN